MKKKHWMINKMFFLAILIFAIFILSLVLKLYRVNYFNEFTRAEYSLYTSEFSRDNDIKYSENASYKINSQVPNDAMFYKTLSVNPNTAYKISCMVKTENVIPEVTPSESGAQISIVDTVEKSTSVIGSSDWQEIALYFNSGNREKVDVAFRLGGYEENCTGTAWFSNFKLSQGTKIEDSEWSVACFIFENLNVNVDVDGTKNYQDVNITMNNSDVLTVKQDMAKFSGACNELSNGGISITYDIIEISDPITTLSHDEANGYYVGAKDINNLISKYINEKQYQHIFAVIKFGDDYSKYEVPVEDWLGLGSMTFNGIGFSNIRLQNSTVNSKYTYSGNNTFPEEVFVHEFIHDLERIATENELEGIIELHDYDYYNYEDERTTGLRKWYNAYMTKSVYDNNTKEYKGLSSEVYELRPVKNEDFKYFLEKELIKEPRNVFEEIEMYLATSIQTAIERSV